MGYPLFLGFKVKAKGTPRFVSGGGGSESDFCSAPWEFSHRPRLQIKAIKPTSQTTYLASLWCPRAVELRVPCKCTRQEESCRMCAHQVSSNVSFAQNQDMKQTNGHLELVSEPGSQSNRRLILQIPGRWPLVGRV